jgi:hypothetical protein
MSGWRCINSGQVFAPVLEQNLQRQEVGLCALRCPPMDCLITQSRMRKSHLSTSRLAAGALDHSQEVA